MQYRHGSTETARLQGAWRANGSPPHGARVALLSPPKKMRGEMPVDREELKARVEELMRQYDKEEIDGATYFGLMMELTTSAQG